MSQKFDIGVVTNTGKAGDKMKFRKIPVLLMMAFYITSPLFHATIYAAEENQTTNTDIPGSYEDEDVSVSFVKAYIKHDDDHYFIDLISKVLSDHKIVKPDNHRSFVDLVDNFGNSLGFNRKGYGNIEPSYYGTSHEIGLRPGEEKIFTIKYSNLPLATTEYLILSVPERTFGNANPFRLKIVDFKPKRFITTTQLDKLVEKLAKTTPEKQEPFLSDEYIVEQSASADKTEQGWIYYAYAFGGILLLVSFAVVIGLIWSSNNLTAKLNAFIKITPPQTDAPHFKPALFSIVLLIIALLSFGELPGGYYMLLRIVVCFSAAFIAYLSFKSGGNWLPWCWVLIAIVFNPVLQIHLDDPEMWQGIDILCVCFFVHSIFAKTYKEVSDK